MKRENRGFTLVELLVVIAIIALLVSILLPALNKVRAQAVAVQCASNMRQCALSVFAYANDNRQMMCPYFKDAGGGIFLWPSIITTTSTGASKGYLQPGPVFGCPASVYAQQDSLIYGKIGFPAQYFGFGMYTPMTGIAALSDPQKIATATVLLPPPATKPIICLLRLTKARPAASYVLITDSAATQPSQFGHNGAAVLADQAGPGYAAYIHTPHNKRCNTLFFDGHAEPLLPADLYNTPMKVTKYLDQNLKLQTYP